MKTSVIALCLLCASVVKVFVTKNDMMMFLSNEKDQRRENANAVAGYCARRGAVSQDKNPVA